MPEGMRTAVKIASIRRGRAHSIRTRVLTIALVPCFVFLLAGVAGAGYLIYDAAKTRSYFNLASQTQDSALPLILSLQEERRLTLRRLASFGTFQSELIKQRAKTDAVVGQVNAKLGELADIAPDSVRRDIAEFSTLMAKLPEVRARVDGGQVGVSESFAFYNQIVDQFVQGSQGLALFAPDAQTSYAQLVGAPLLTGADLMQRADALAAANVVGGGLTDLDFRTFQGQVSAYHLQLDAAIPLAEPGRAGPVREAAREPGMAAAGLGRERARGRPDRDPGQRGPVARGRARRRRRADEDAVHAERPDQRRGHRQGRQHADPRDRRRPARAAGRDRGVR